MDIKKYEQLINLVINENEEQARELFHEIVVEKSREIFESIMTEEFDDEDMTEGHMGGQVGDLLDEINVEEEGVTEEEEDDIDFGDEEEITFGDEEGEEEGGEEEVEDAVIRIEDKLDQLMAEFEELMGAEEAEHGEDFGGEEGEEDFGGEEGEEDFADFGDEGEEEAMMEAVQLQKVSVTHGDNGQNTKSPVTFNSGKAGMDSNPVNFGGSDEKGRSAPGTKDLPGAGKFKNAPGHKGQDLSAAPKPKHGDDGSNTKSPVAESRRSVKRRIR